MFNTAKKQFQRKVIFIKRNMQFKFIAFVLLAVLFGMSLLTYEFLSLISEIFSNHPVLLQVFFEEGSSLLFIFAIKIVVCFAVLALLAAVLSNKIAGPIYRFETACKEVANGNCAVRVNLREGDSLKDLEKEFNSMMDSIESKKKEEEGK